MIILVLPNDTQKELEQCDDNLNYSQWYCGKATEIYFYIYFCGCHRNIWDSQTHIKNQIKFLSNLKDTTDEQHQCEEGGNETSCGNTLKLSTGTYLSERFVLHWSNQKLQKKLWICT